MQKQVNRTNRSEHYVGDIDDRAKTIFLLAIVVSFIGLALITTPVSEIGTGLLTIITSPSNLFNDYIDIAGFGAALVNVALMIFIQTSLVKLAKQYMNGNIFSSILMVAGHAFLGINPLNSLAPMLGSYLYAKISQTRVSSILHIMFGVTSISPIASVIFFGDSFHPIVRVLLGIVIGALAGFIAPILSPTTLKFHHGYTILDGGFSSGMIALVLVSILRFMNVSVDLQTPGADYQGYELAVLLAIIYIGAILVAVFFSSASVKGYSQLMKHKGRLVDYQVLFGTGNSVLNVGIMGLMSISYVLLMGGHFSGPVLAAIIPLSGYAVLGMNPRRSAPLIFGAFFAQVLNPNIDPTVTSSINAALFSSALSPIVGEFGVFAGIVAGFIHASVVGQVAYLHGGVDVFNNGFASGFVAMILTGVLYYIRKVQNKRSNKPNKDLSLD